MQRRQPEGLIEFGRVAGAFGVRGWLKVAARGEVAVTLAAAPEWWIDGRRHRVMEARVHGASVVAKLETIDVREAALAFRGKSVALLREALPAPEAGHYYLVDLVGLDVVNQHGERLGTVRRWITNGAQDVMEVDGRLIPWVAAVVKEVDLERRRIEVAWEADW